MLAIDQALALPIVAALPLFEISVRRFTQVEDEVAQIDREIAAARCQLVESHARFELSGKTALQRIAANESANQAKDMLEMVTAFGRSSLPQDDSD